MDIYDNFKNGYNSIFNELVILSDKINKLPNIVTFAELKKRNCTLQDLSIELYNIHNEINKYMNHI